MLEMVVPLCFSCSVNSFKSAFGIGRPSQIERITKSVFSYKSRSLATTAHQNWLSFDYSVDITDSDYVQVLTAKNVPCTLNLRQHYDELFRDPREPSARRFVWDTWVVCCGEGKAGNQAPLPGDEDYNQLQAPCEGEREAAASQIQYSLKRAQCSEFFAQSGEENDVYEQLIEDITKLGQSIGCSCTTPPWISLYTPGDQQNLHMDSTHGPMAWVLSITNDADYGKTFTGGETLLLQPRILEFWKDYSPDTGGKETPTILRFIPPRFGQCIAFDPRIPHGVNLIKGGSNDPRHGRIVLHGWFAEPEITWLGDEDNDYISNEELQQEAQEILDAKMDALLDGLADSDIGRVIGYLALRVDISPKGTVDGIHAVCDTLKADPSDYRGVIGEDPEGRQIMEDATADIRLTINENLSEMYFPETKSGGSVVVPFDFL